MDKDKQAAQLEMLKPILKAIELTAKSEIEKGAEICKKEGISPSLYIPIVAHILLRMAGGLIGCISVWPIKKQMLEDASSIVLEGARASESDFDKMKRDEEEMLAEKAKQENAGMN